jgi:tetratricopeptide (TPR) repeat protein
LVFQNKELGNFFNNTFITFRTDPSKESWKELREKFDIQGTPTVVLIKPDGEELDRINGFDEADEFVGAVKEYLAGNNLLSSFIAAAKENPEDIKANFDLAKKYASRWEDDKAYPYYAKTLELDPDDTKGFRLEATFNVAINKIRSRENPNPEPLKQFIAENTNDEYMLNSYSSLARYYQTHEQKDKVMPLWEELLAKRPDNPDVMNEYAYNVFNLKDETRYEKAKAQAEKSLTVAEEDDLFMSYYNLIRYHRLKEENEKALAMYELAATKVPKEPFFKYGYGATALLIKKTSAYDQGIEMVKKAIEMNDGSPLYWDTLAGLYLEKGELEEAIKAQEKALELMPDNKAFLEKLETYRGTEKK